MVGNGFAHFPTEGLMKVFFFFILQFYLNKLWANYYSEQQIIAHEEQIRDLKGK